MYGASDWKSFYYEGLSSRRLPIDLIFITVAAHYMCCTGITRVFWDTGIQKHGEMMPILTPLHLLKNSMQSCHNSSILEKENEDVAAIIESSWIDPLSYIYETAANVLNEPIKDDPDPPSQPPLDPEPTVIDNHCGIHQICIMYSASIGLFLAVWLPGTYNKFCTKSAAVWTIGSISATCSFSCWCVCMFMYSTPSLRKLSLCVSMHLPLQLLDAYGFLAHADPSAPIYMPMWVERGIRMGQGIMICYITHSTGSLSEFHTLDFYMSHMWSVAVIEVIRTLLLGPIVLLLGMTSCSKSKYD